MEIGDAEVFEVAEALLEAGEVAGEAVDIEDHPGLEVARKAQRRRLAPFVQGPQIRGPRGEARRRRLQDRLEMPMEVVAVAVKGEEGGEQVRKRPLQTRRERRLQ